MANTFLRSILAAVGSLTLVIAWPATEGLLAQRQSPAAGPWSGQATCVVVAKWADYFDEQTHTWKLTGEAPASAPRGSAQVYYTWPSTWSVTGGGRKAFAPRTSGATGRDESERWTIANEMNATLRITEIVGTPVRLRIGAEGQRGGPLGSIRVTEVSGRTRDASVQPWQFPTIEDDATSTTISGTSTRTLPEGFGVGWGQPRNAITTATCTWSFTRGGVEQSSAITLDGGRAPRPVGTLAGAGATGVQAPLTPAARTFALAGFTASGTAIIVAARMIPLNGFTAAGTAVVVAPQTIALAGFTASGTAVLVTPRTIALPGFAAAGELESFRRRGK